MPHVGLSKEAKQVLMCRGEMEDHRPMACLTKHVNPNKIMQLPNEPSEVASVSPVDRERSPHDL
jgi:hypothetical protein